MDWPVNSMAGFEANGGAAQLSGQDAEAIWRIAGYWLSELVNEQLIALARELEGECTNAGKQRLYELGERIRAMAEAP